MSRLSLLHRARSMDHLHHLVGLLKGHILGFPHSRPDSEAQGVDPETYTFNTHFSPPPRSLCALTLGNPYNRRGRCCTCMTFKSVLSLITWQT